MPSSNKTQHLRLNRWLGEDKPKRDDFNDDNLLIDAAIKTLQEEIAAAVQAMSAQFTELGGIVSQNQQVLAANLSAHTGDTVPHITAVERQNWNKAAPVTGTYTGDGNAERKITLGFKPRFGLVYGVDQSPADYNSTSQYMYLYYAFYSELGSSGGFSAVSDGFTVRHNTNATPYGFAYKLNQTGMTYVYVVWR